MNADLTYGESTKQGSDSGVSIPSRAYLVPGAGRVRAIKPEYRRRTLKKIETELGTRTVVSGGGFRSKLHQLISKHCVVKDDAVTRTSFTTQRNLRTGLSRLFEVLIGKYKLENPANLDGRHIQYLYDWMEERYRNGLEGKKPALSAATIDGYVSYLRHFCRWIGQPELIKRAGVKFQDESATKRTAAATRDKTWEGQGIDIAAKIDEAYRVEEWVGIALLAQHAFGLRRKEAVCLVPTKKFNAEIGYLSITEGAKGGRSRLVFFTEPSQYEVMALILEWLREQRRPNTHIGGTDRDLQAVLRRYAHVLAKIGITKDTCGTTGHGLRAGFACRLLESFGVTPVVKGGKPGELDPVVVRTAMLVTTEAMGHGRLAPVGAYAGNERTKLEAQANLPTPCPPLDMPALIAQIRERRAEAKRLAKALKQEFFD
ncbi:integrase domain-containing protein [Paucibacter sp. DJ1R-11]|uniref:integrase domain-containing protein n=1 Tax=Paucibacter sp. DJ1R-11 TaxID=2893556 RepID=UPI0021E4FCD3|nr:integrase domain-containing protein [Paucibacter sp. DJ1R-11]